MAARNKRYPTIFPADLAAIERQATLLQNASRSAMVSLAPSCLHYDALMALNGQIAVALNLLNDRPADWERPR